MNRDDLIKYEHDENVPKYYRYYAEIMRILTLFLDTCTHAKYTELTTGLEEDNLTYGLLTRIRDKMWEDGEVDVEELKTLACIGAMRIFPPTEEEVDQVMKGEMWKSN